MVALEPLYIYRKGIGNENEKGVGGWQWKKGVGNRLNDRVND